MNDAQTLWVLGHQVRLLSTDESYGLVEISTPPGVQGPPPHVHRDASEFFLILGGTLDVMRDGEWARHGAGSFVELAPGTVHTFVNRAAEDVVWLTGWRPKGFQQFFRDFGIAARETDARARSLAPEVIRRVMESCERYGMQVRA